LLVIKSICPLCKATYVLPGALRGHRVKCAKCGRPFISRHNAKLIDDWVISAGVFLLVSLIASFAFVLLVPENETRGQIYAIVRLTVPILIISGIGFLVSRYQHWINRNLELVLLSSGSTLICLGLWLGVISIAIAGGVLALAGTMKRVLFGGKTR
jgi:hypothetical protein